MPSENHFKSKVGTANPRLDHLQNLLIMGKKFEKSELFQRDVRGTDNSHKLSFLHLNQYMVVNSVHGVEF